MRATDSSRMKKAAEWFYGTIFKDEPIRPQVPRPEKRVPSLIRTARSLENGTNNAWQSRESIFLKQAKLLVNYEDDYEFHKDIVRYYPTYQSLTDQELRGYFSWRTKLRKGDIQKTSLSFAFLYIYELINMVGAAGPMDGYRKLKAFQDAYGQLDNSILPYLNRWITDYVVYYELDANLLADLPQVSYDRSITVLENIKEQGASKVIYAVKQISPKWLERSKFYGTHHDDMDIVIVRVLCRVSDHYATRCKKGFVEQYFGSLSQNEVRLFDTAVFCDPLKKRNFEYAVDERYVYHCKNGHWTVTKHPGPPRQNAKLGDLLKSIDSIMREEYAYKHPVKCELETKWIQKIIHEEIQVLLSEKKSAEAKKVAIDYSQLEKIRKEAAITQEKLTVDEELEEDTFDVQTQSARKLPDPTSISSDSASPDNSTPLNSVEYRLMQCLLYGKDYAWVQAEGYMLSVLSDSINDKLYDMFMDSVMDDSPELVEDYIDDLKEMIKP